MKDSIMAYATALCDFMGGTQYGHMGNDPAPPEGLDATSLGYVRRLVCDGKRAGLASMQGDWARVNANRESVAKLRPLVKPLGVSADELFSIGYRAGR